MDNYREILGAIAVIIGVLSYIPYFRDIFRGHTKPHAFSWGMWGVLTSIAFAAQITEGAGPGAWVTGATALSCFTIATIALIKGRRDFPKIDWLFLASSVTALILWWATDNPLLAVILITLTDALSFAPTFRKAYYKPNEETVSTFAVSSLKFGLGIIALQSVTVVNWLYPASLVLMNGLFVLLLLVRRRQIKTQ